MKRVLVMTLAMILIASQAYASFLDDLFNHNQNAAKDGNVWYDRNFDFSTIDSIAVYPMDVQFNQLFHEKYPDLRENVTQDIHRTLEWDRSSWEKASIFPDSFAYSVSVSTQETLKHQLIETFPNKIKTVFLVTPTGWVGSPHTPRKGASDAYAAYRKTPGEMRKLSPEEAEEVFSKENLYKVEYPALMETYESEDARGAAVREATGAAVYLRWFMKGPYTPNQVDTYSLRVPGYYGVPKQVTVSLYTSCGCTLYDGNGREILAYSAKVPRECDGTPSVSMGKKNNENSAFVRGLVDNLEKLMAAKTAEKAPLSAKTVRAGEITLDYLEGEETYPAEVDITKKALSTTVLENADEAKSLRAAEGDVSDYILEAAVTDCTVKMESGRKKGSEPIDTSFRATLKAAVRLIDARTGAVVKASQGEASGRTESEAFGKIVKKFFGEVEKTVK